MLDDIVDLFRGQFGFVYILVILPVTLCTLVPQKTTIMQEFKAFRLQHFDLAGNQRGSRGWRVNFEATSVSGRNLIRRCLVVSWKDLNPSLLHETFNPNLGAVLIVVPSEIKRLNVKEREMFLALEQSLLEKSFNFPVFLAPDTPDLVEMLHSIEHQSRSENGTAASMLISAVTANAFQLVSSGQASSVTVSTPVHNIVAKLSSFDRSDQIPAILLVAHYDSFGAAPALSFGSDSNGSGVTAMLELLRLFSKLYQSSSSRAKYNLIFLLSAAGKFNYMGTRQWIDEYLEQSESAQGSTQKLEFAICLDSLAGHSELNMHVSKHPREGSAVDKFLTRLNEVASSQNRTINVSPKKINLGDDYLAWEHERFSIRKLYGFTLSHYASPRNPLRHSILDTSDRANVEILSKNIEVVAEALTKHLFQLSPDVEQKFFDELKVEKNFLKSWMNLLSSQPRSQQMFKDPPAKDPLLSDLLAVFDHYGQEAHFSPVKVDKRDPEFVLYGATVDTLYAYKVKPAVFDLILALFIAGYLGLVYLFVLNAAHLQYKSQSIIDSIKLKRA